MDTERPSSNLEPKITLINKLLDYGYESQGAEYKKSFVSYSITKDGNGKFPLIMSVNLDHPDAINISGSKEKSEVIIRSLFDILTDKDDIDIHINKNPQKPDYTKESMSSSFIKESNLIIADSNWTGVEYIEKVFEQLKVPNFDNEYREAKKLPKAKFLKDLGFKISRNKEKENRLTGDLLFCHVEHAKINNPTPEQESYVPYEFKIRLNFNDNSLYSKMLIKDVKKMSVQIIKVNGSPKYRDGEKTYLEKNPIFYRVDDGGVVGVVEMIKTVQNLISIPTGQ